ncbi:MAG TPA: acyltransferase [Gemmatimonadaceae bacterium]|nr:acyltransferase [Gemmatimonadaceae bacterium]
MTTLAASSTDGDTRTITKPAFTSRVHIPTLDGLRGVAIVAVMLRHFVTMPELREIDIPFLLASGGGWVGVDLFFALSGFLITGILIDVRGSQGWVRNFFVRRALRIIPLYAATVAVLTLSLPLLARLDPASAYGAQVFHAMRWWYWTHSVNLMLAVAGRWQVTQLNTAHFWSLALEEQFYLVWPLVVALCPPRRLAVTCLVIAAGSALTRVVFVLAGASPVTVYALPFTHLDALALGSALAVARRTPWMWDRIKPRARAFASVPGLRWWSCIFIGLTVMVLLDHSGGVDSAMMQMIGFPLIGLAAVSLVAASLEAPVGSALRRWLSSPVLQGLGRYSYGIYVLHYPLFYLLVHMGLDVRRMPTIGGSLLIAQCVVVAVAATASVGLAWLSYRYLERPFLRMKQRFPLTSVDQSRIADVDDPMARASQPA